MKKLNQHVMTQKFREGLADVYRTALQAIGVEPDLVQPHIIGTCTVTITDGELAILRAHYGNAMTELTPHRNSGAIEILIPEGEDFLTENRPTMTDDERAKKRASGKGVNREETEKRRAKRQELRRKLAELHGIDLDSDEAADILDSFDENNDD